MQEQYRKPMYEAKVKFTQTGNSKSGKTPFKHQDEVTFTFFTSSFMPEGKAFHTFRTWYSKFAKVTNIQIVRMS